MRAVIVTILTLITLCLSAIVLHFKNRDSKTVERFTVLLDCFDALCTRLDGTAEVNA